VQIAGNLQIIAQSQERTAPIIMPKFPVGEYGTTLVRCKLTTDVNFAYDWLPFYLTPFFTTPIAHFVSMGSLYDAMDQIVEKWRLSSWLWFFYTHRRQFAIDQQCPCLSSRIDLSLYQFCTYY